LASPIAPAEEHEEVPMNVREVMTARPVCCTPDANLREVARLMVEHDCGEIPVVDSRDSMRPIGVVTDRDITCRVVAAGRNPLELTAADCMSSPVICVTPDTDLDECCNLMEDNQVRRVPVVDESGSCCGIVSQSDVARKASRMLVSELVREVSEPSGAASRAPGR
jgi:CBS domain-containing protein